MYVWQTLPCIYSVHRPYTLGEKGVIKLSLLTIHFPSHQENLMQPLIDKINWQLLTNIHSNDKKKKFGRQQELALPIVLKVDIKKRMLVFEPELPQFQLLLHGPILYELLAEELGTFIVENCEADIIHTLLRHRCEKNNINPLSVAQYCYNILNNDPWEPLGKKFTEEDRSRRSSKIADELKQHLELNSQLHLGGYIRFRLHSYKKELNEVVEYAMDEYILDQQYEEFMSLLKYFVQLQETRVDLVHLVQQEGSSFQICDDSMKPLELKHDNDRIVAEMLETEINIEDIVISSLISASPQKIMIHAKHHDYQVLRTVKTIFGDRAQFCTTCPMCRSTQEEIVPFQ